jgi:hypothetical protein
MTDANHPWGFMAARKHASTIPGNDKAPEGRPATPKGVWARPARALRLANLSATMRLSVHA